ncbi:MAG: hypothetical protein CR975_06495 [Gammaproteobacteria bacterium]|nr:MAG: hypothetical protein CR975_06495 [Gammaproteobacteria bacterium]
MTLIALALTGCDEVVETFEQSSRSGTVIDDDVEAPLSDKAKQYEKALELSNRFLVLWQKKDFHSIHEQLVDPEMQSRLSVEKLADIDSHVEKAYGKLVGFKKGQWAFEPKRAKKQYFLFSIKSVTHEKTKLNYLFQFVLDNKYEKLVGFYVREKPALRAPGQIHSNKQ